MILHIKELILWPRRTGLAPRKVTFAPGKMNIITGASRTGKSAVTPIIDYCLGARRCGIPVETIRNACSWFGVVVITPQGEKLFARREPGDQRSTDDMFVAEAPTITVPNQIALKNASADQVRRSLDELWGLSNLDFSAGQAAGAYPDRPSFRDLNAFVFQPQNVIANPDVLFYKADTQEHREKLKTIFPYVLNAITPDILAKEHELRRLERELLRRDRELKTAQEVSQEWLARIRSTLNEARELGLVDEALPNELTREEMIELLTKVVQTTDRTAKVSNETISESLKELSGLEKEEAQLSQELTSLRRRLAEMRRLRDSTSDYQEALKIQRDRLKVSDWLFEIHTGTEKCPICQNQMDQNGDELHRLRSALNELEQTSAGVKEIPASFEREYQRVQEALQLTTDKLRAVEIRRTALTGRSREAERRQFEIKRVERFIGRLESDLKTYERLGVDNQLSAEVQRLRERVTVLKAEVDAADVKRAVQRALRIVNSNAGRLLPGLDVEYPDSPVQLDISNLTVKVTRERRDDFLWEIGSGSNWLSYHLAAMLGLQQFFMSHPHNVVPSLLVFDQPSQVYFPKLLVQKTGQETPEPQFVRDEDVAAVRKAFSVINQVVTAANGKLQAIVLDHAPEEVWGGLPGVHLVEEWRGGKYLVPAEWLK
jgi:uncharacterized Zn finger protein (UPF0148 family)